MFPSTNPYDIPDLLPQPAFEIASPVIQWGSISRGVRMPGTWVFYVEDYRFSRLLREPLQLPATGCNAATEPNITLFDQSPIAEAIWNTFRKRTLARQWQMAGVNVLVDLNVPERHRDVCMLGVPRGWTMFATRGYAARPNDLRLELAIAREWGGSTAQVLVYGGGKGIEEICRSERGALYVTARVESVRG